MTDDRTIRAFLALDHPDAIGRIIAAVQERLKKCVFGEIRWVRPEGIHLTLKYFGDVSAAQAAAIAAVVEKKAVETPSFALSLGGIGVFPDPRRPRVLWLGMKGELERLLGFQETLERAFIEIGFPREQRPFRPHLTLARIRPSGPRGVTGLGKALEKGGETAGEGFIAAGISLLQSTLTPQGAIYTRLGGFPLAG